MRARSGERRYTPTAFFWRNRHTRLPAAKKIVQTRSIDRGSRMTSTQADEPLLRSAERREGQASVRECRYRCSPYHLKNNVDRTQSIKAKSQLITDVLRK